MSARAIASDLCSLGLADVRLNVDLRAHSRWRSGGRGALVVAPHSRDSVLSLLAYFHERGIAWAVIGEGSNLFFDDAGVEAPLIHIGPRLGAISVANERLHAEAGAWAPGVALAAMRAGLGGIEHTVGIPGAFGGLVLMNGGSLRRGVGENIAEVELAEPNGALRLLDRDACGFAYRVSALSASGGIVLGATLQLVRRDRASMRRDMIEIMSSRRQRFPRDWPNCGSVFVSDPALYATIGPPGAAIEAAGLKGARIGDAQVSPRHANFIVNTGNARSRDIIALIKRVREAVATRTGHRMRCEVRFMNADGQVREVHDWLDDPNWMDRPADALAMEAADG